MPLVPSVDPPPPEDPTRCQLLGPTALAVQAAMGVFVILSLVVKRHFDKRKRPWRIWLLDVGKQLVGQAVLHTLNLLISGLIAEDQHNNPCSTYFLNILIDTTIGVLIIYFALRAATVMMERYFGMDGLKSGYYGDPPQWTLYACPQNPLMSSWWRQLIPYLIAVLVMKLVVILPLTLPGISTLLLRFGHAAIEYLSPSVQVIFVMALFPLIMNVVQFCLVDQVIKAGKVDDDIEEGYERVVTDAEESRVALVKSSPQNSAPSSPLLSAADSMAYGAEDSHSHSRQHRSSAPSPDPAAFGSISRLSEDWQREARRSLSPKTRASITGAQRESVSMSGI